MEFSDTLDGQGGDFANSAAVFLPLLPTTPRKAKMTEICGNFFTFLSVPTPPKIENCQTKSVSCFPFRGAIRRFFKNAENKRKKTGNLFMISCFGVPFYVAAVIQFWGMAVHQSGTGTGQR